MSFKADEKKIRLLMSNAVYAIPRNQRRYVWDKTNWHALYEDINFVVNTPKYNKDHFIGSIVLQSEKSKDNIDHYTIIDGQQRIITISLFLSAIMYIYVLFNQGASLYNLQFFKLLLYKLTVVSSSIRITNIFFNCKIFFL